MMLVPMVAVAAATLGLTVSSVRNMAQTYEVSRKQQELELCSWTPPANAYEAVSQLQAMKRKELLELFLSCEAPSSVSEIYGEWNGSLLENNGWILTTVTRFLTNALFGEGRAWSGKAFRDNNLGVNRFHAKNGDATEYQHEFDYTIEPSHIGVSKKPSVSLVYSKYQFPLSLWYSMTDEVRFVPVANDNGQPQVLIGFGSMTWSGGKMNASPFCLWKTNSTIE